MEYRELGLDEIVPENAEVLVQDWTNPDASELEDRSMNSWNPANNTGYLGRTVSNCKGSMTGRQRIFRVPVESRAFQPGDRVRRVKVSCDKKWCIEIGSKTTVCIVDDKYFQSKETNFWYYVSDFELVQDDPMIHESPTLSAAPCEQTTNRATRYSDDGGIIVDDKASEALCRIIKNYEEMTANVLESAQVLISLDSDTSAHVETPSDPAPGVACVMFGSKPRTMYAAKTWHGPNEDEIARNEATEEERRRYEI